MNKFDFYQDVKCSIWLRQFFTIEAENEKEAKMKAKEFQDKDVSKSTLSLIPNSNLKQKN